MPTQTTWQWQPAAADVSQIVIQLFAHIMTNTRDMNMKIKLRKYAEYEDMVVAGEYSDEGFSGKNIQGRHEFQRMLQDIQDCKDGVEYVLVFKLSRFGRNAADVLNSLQLMQDFGVNLICVEAVSYTHLAAPSTMTGIPA